ncbi:Nucleotidyltransferase domain-containing protein [Thermoleophilum album]|uniref:Nucleotidyltransferase domain-containing protein n=1 Tax=Thermoleophilum album TaxID=29539 RepID=A0A1H6FJ45_THEAL|nr:Nucleotidyltransferase domain-containing protein [Thermoleophilum album]
MRLAVLFGSQATGRATERSDVDLLVALTDPAAARVAALTDAWNAGLPVTCRSCACRTQSRRRP